MGGLQAAFTKLYWRDDAHTKVNSYNYNVDNLASPYYVCWSHESSIS